MSFERTDKGLMIEKHDDVWARAVVTVVSVDGSTATVEPSGTALCGKCSGATGCGTRTLANLLGNRIAPLRVENNLNASVGDQVEIGIEQATMLKLSALSYLVPLAGLLFGGVIASMAGLSESLAFISGIAGLAIGFAIGRRLFSKDRWEQRIVPTCLRRVASEQEQYVDVRAIT